MRRIKSGFTIVEILIVIAIIGILSTIGLVSFTRYQQDARDSQRSSKATILAEALEKYYDKNGEYPSCTALQSPSSTVITSVLPGLEKNTLVAPGSPSDDNSIKCQDLTTSSPGDYFAYVGGDTSPECLSGSACVLFTIEYKDESTGTIKTIDSRRQVAIAGVPNLTCTTASFTQIGCLWTSVPGASSYDIQYATNTGFTTGVVTTPTSILQNDSTGLGYCTTYSFRVRAVSISGPGTWSATSTKTTQCLATPSCSLVANSFTQITASGWTVPNATSYTLEYDDTSNFSSLVGTYSGTAVSKIVTGLNYGTTYYFRVKAVVASGNSPWSSTCQIATLSLATPVISSTPAGISQVTVSWGAITNANAYTLDYDDNSDFSSLVGSVSVLSGTSASATGLYPGTTYYFRVKALNNPYGSNYSSTATQATTSPTLSGSVTCAGTYSGRSAFQLRVTATEVSYNIPANQSNVSWTIYRYAAASGWQSFDQTKTWPWGVNINGSGYSGSSNSGTWRYSASVAGQTETIASGTTTIAHDGNGNATIGYSGADGPGSSIFGSGSCSGSYGLSDLR